MLKKAFKSIAPLPMLERISGRKRRIYALGTAKSGTTSIAEMFSDILKSDHEPHRPATVSDMYKHFTGNMSDAQIQKTYRARDKQLLLDLESNCFLAYRPDLLRSTFADGKYIVLIRDPMTWLDSIFDNNINFPRDKTLTLAKWHSVLFHSDKMRESSNDDLLVELGLYPVNCYLDYWARTYDRCLRALSDSQCILVGTNQITRRAEEIGEFIGLDTSRIEPGTTHRNSTTEKHGILRRLDSTHVAESLRKVCQPLIDEFDLARLWTQSS